MVFLIRGTWGFGGGAPTSIPILPRSIRFKRYVRLAVCAIVIFHHRRDFRSKITDLRLSGRATMLFRHAAKA